MSRIMKPLLKDVHFYTAQIDRTPVVVFLENELIGSGVIEDITEHSVKIKGEHYFREICIFKYAG